MASEVGICNAALQMVKQSKRIESLTQGTREANACEVIYEELRDQLLEMHNWNFATKRVKLSQLVTAPVFEWDHAYQLPSDWIRITQVFQNSTGRARVAYKIEGDTLVSDHDDIWLRYVSRETDPNKMRPLFRLALSKLIASRLAVALAQSASQSKELLSQFMTDDLPRAKASDAIQDFEHGIPESEWVSARHGWNSYAEPGEVDV